MEERGWAVVDVFSSQSISQAYRRSSATANDDDVFTRCVINTPHATQSTDRPTAAMMNDAETSLCCFTRLLSRI